MKRSESLRSQTSITSVIEANVKTKAKTNNATSTLIRLDDGQRMVTGVAA